MNNRILLAFMLLCLCFLNACKKSSPPALPANKDILSFVFKTSLNSAVLQADVYGLVGKDSIIAKVPVGTAITALTPDLTISGKSVNPTNHTAQNFTNPVRYTVTAEDGSQRLYTVLVKYLSTSKEILSFVFKAADNPGLTVDLHLVAGTDTLSAVAPPEIDLHKLVPSITFNGQQISPADKSQQDFSVPVNYTVTAEDGSVRKYTVILGSNKLLFTGCSNGYLYALDANTGKIKWQYNCGVQVLNPAFSNGYVYTMLSDGQMLAADAATGAKKWQVMLMPGLYQLPVIQDGIICVTMNVKNGGAYLFAVDQSSGTILWQQGPANDSYSCPSMANGIVIVPSFNTGILAFKTAGGGLAWTRPNGITVGNPIVKNNTVYFGGESAFLEACDITTGAFKWKSIYAGGMPSATAVGAFIYSAASASLFASNIADGIIAWRFDLGTNALFTAPSVTNGILVSGFGTGQILTLNTITGKFLWQKDYWPALQLTSFVAANGWIYFGLTDGRLLALDAATGATRWTFQQAGATVGNPVVIDAKGIAYHVTDSGNQQ